MVKSKALKNIRKVKKKLKKSEKNLFLTAKSNTATEIKEKAKNVERPEGAAKVIQEFEQIITSNKKYCLISISTRVNI